MEDKLVLNLDKVRQGVAVGEGELLHKAQMEMLLAKIRQIMASVEDFRRQFESGQRQSSISHRRHHDAILLSGARGAGKTTFLLSALHKLQNERLDDNYAFCVFEPVDPTLFGCNEHILLTLLSMIAERVAASHAYSDTAHYCHNSGSGDWESWERQLKELAKGLRTVGEQREDIGSGPSPRKDVWDDAEYLLEQGMDSARSSYELEYKLHAFIHTSLKLLHKDAFVLGLDDVDTRPGIGWHVLEVLRRYLTTPQIIVIVSGNMELFQKLVERQQLKNFGLDFSSNNNVLQDFAPQVTELTNQYLLKVLRTPMRIELLPFYEALECVSGKDEHYQVKLFGVDFSLSSVLNIFYNGLACNSRQNMKNLFRKALFSNSARTVLQVVEQLIGLQHQRRKEKDTTLQTLQLRCRVADILRTAFFDYMVASGIPQPQEYFERLREGVGIEEITRLLLTGKLPGDASLLPVFGEQKDTNSLLALTGALTAAMTENISVFFIYFFKACFALHVLQGREYSDINTVLNETALNSSAFRCSFLLYGDIRRPGWRAPGILAIYSVSAEKNIPQRVKFIYGENIGSFLKHNSPLKLSWPEELQPFINKVCTYDIIPRMRGYIMTTLEDLQNNIKSWHKELIPHGFYEVMRREGSYRFFSIWGLIGLVAEILTCTTEDDIFDVLFSKSRVITLYNDEFIYTLDEDSHSKYNDEYSEKESKTSDYNYDKQLDEWQQDFIERIFLWRNTYSKDSVIYSTPSLLCIRIFSRFLQGLERLNGINSSNVFLGNYIHRSLVIFFNSILVEEYIACFGNGRGLNMTIPLVKDDIFIYNYKYIIEKETNKTSENKKLFDEKCLKNHYPLTRLIISYPLWLLYIKPDEQDNGVVSILKEIGQVTSATQHSQTAIPTVSDAGINMNIVYGDNNVIFKNFYDLLNALAIQRKVEISVADKVKTYYEDTRTELGRNYDLPRGKRRIHLAEKMMEAIRTESDLKEKYGSRIESLDDEELKELLSYFYDTIYPEWLTSQALQELKKYMLEEYRKTK